MKIIQFGFAWFGAVALAASCSFDKSGPSSGADGGGGNGDGGPGGADAMPGPDAMPDPCEGWDPAAPFDPCEIAEGDRGDDLKLEQNVIYTYDTTGGTLQVDDGTPSPLPCTAILDDSACLLSVASLTVGSNAIVRVVGDKALLVASWDTIKVAGEIDASSVRDGDGVEQDGAGANPSGCPDLAAGMDALGPGGGGGGGLATAGGDGGEGVGPMDSAATAGPAVGTIVLRGGCPGGAGGALAAAGDRADGGSGGGAIALSAFTSVTVSGSAVVQAGGAGGAGGAAGDMMVAIGTGGGGGGSGGVVWLDAPNINLGTDIILAANGGGGGEGGDSNQIGDDGDDARSDAVPLGGTGNNQGGDGGGGVNGNDTEGETGDLSDSTGGAGGGGGGGGGLIRLDGEVSDDGATITPEP